MTSLPPSLHSIFEQLEDHLRFQKETGSSSIELSREAVEILREIQPRPSIQAAPAPTPAVSITPERAPPVTPPTPAVNGAPGDASERLAAIANELIASDFCPLKQNAINTVPGQGSSSPDIVFIGDSPSQEDDEHGQAFVGRSGEVLDRLIRAMGLTRDDVWLGNIVKWRPPNNRPPTAEEISSCLPYLVRQLEILQPKAIICLGGIAAKALLDTSDGIMGLRGNWKEFNQIPLMPTYHPSFLQRSQNKQQKQRFWEVWSDMEAVMVKLGMPVPQKEKK